MASTALLPEDLGDLLSETPSRKTLNIRAIRRRDYDRKLRMVVSGLLLHARSIWQGTPTVPSVVWGTVATAPAGKLEDMHLRIR
jgi:hypothetical protein